MNKMRLTGGLFFLMTEILELHLLRLRRKCVGLLATEGPSGADLYERKPTQIQNFKRQLTQSSLAQTTRMKDILAVVHSEIRCAIVKENVNAGGGWSSNCVRVGK